MILSHFKTHLFSRRRTARILYAVAAAATLSAVIGTLVQPATAATDGSDWGSQGAIAGVDPVTVSWDNAGNPAGDVVPRDSSQTLPYTNGKTYSDIDAGVASEVQTDFQNMKLSVSQTTNLGDQAVQVGLTGVAGGAGNAARGTYIQVFQCWGQDGDSEPDPTHCEAGAGGSDFTELDVSRNVASQDKTLTAGGNLKAVTTITLDNANSHNQSTLVGSTATLRAEVIANGTQVATGAAGTVNFMNAAGSLIAQNVPVVQGVATTTVNGMSASDPQAFTASYNATVDENYTSSTSMPVTLPLPVDVNSVPALLPEASYTLSYNSGYFGDSDPISIDLDGAPSGTATADAFGGLADTITLPAGLSNTNHTLTFTDAKTGTVASFNFTVATAFTPPKAGLGTNSSPNNTVTIGFHGIDGGWSLGTNISNSYYSLSTTNELSGFAAPASATASTSRPFQIKATDQSAGLGCGLETGQPSTSSCWLVAVPRGFGESDTNSPLSPSLWANRVQVKLSFTSIPTGCSGSQTRTLVSGAETLSRAAASWTPALCTSQQVALGYTNATDDVTRQQYSSGTISMGFSSGPIDDDSGGTQTVYAPVALTGVTIAVHIVDGSGALIPNIKLNARLIVKLLTESYEVALDSVGNGGSQVAEKLPWSGNEIRSLANDPEFQKLNPDLPSNSAVSLGDIIVSGGQSDATSLLWHWLVSDPQAKAFLDGCPDSDSNNSVINPFYSTRTYSECPADKSELETTEKAAIAETEVSSNYVYQTPVYPPTDDTFPQPQYYERDAVNKSGAASVNNTTALGLGDIHPQETSMDAVGQDVARGIEKANTLWCAQATNASCTSGPGTPGEWTSAAISGDTWDVGAALGVTQSSTSAALQETTADLCDDVGNCVGADTKSLQQAAADFADTSTPGFQESKVMTGDLDSDQASKQEADGAYPLALPVYAEVNTKGLLAADAKTYAKIIDYATTTGQIPGLAAGQLPPGYAPLTSAEVAQAQETVKTLEDITDPSQPGGTATPASSDSGVPGSGGGPVGDSGNTPVSATAPGDRSAPAGNAAPAVSTGGNPAVPVVLATSAVTSKTAIGFPQYGVVGGLSVGLLAGVAAPIIGRTRKGERR